MQISSTAVNYSTYDKSQLDVENNQGELSKEDFMSLFITQLKNQDPTSPMDNNAMMDQTATFTQVELMTNMEKHLEQIAGGSDSANQQAQMASAASFIGKYVEYEGGETYLSEGAAQVSFQAEQVPYKTTVVIKDEDGNFVRNFSPKVNGTDKVTIYWDGTNADGKQVPDGKYSFSVVATDTDGEKIDVTKYGSGIVTGVKTADNGLVYEVNGSDIKADKVFTVRDLAALGGA